ncbi:hypothetical protein [Arthrobacter celericrescens]|uniref:hypothetical protein n=1 Tax=Arthrobacter celericrescens TaxID=2320851 RepID=UPI000EA21FA0|nr:hypothetical protein [Arthrobacter celericrescens]
MRAAEEDIVGILDSITKGMPVVDGSGQVIGRVEEIVPPNEKAEIFEEAVVGSEPDLLTLGLNSVFGREPKVPELMARRLFHAGYIKIDARGFLASDTYAAADSISRVEEGKAYLSLTRHELSTQV